MKLRFYARGDGLVTKPGALRAVGQVAEYIGRSSDGRSFPASRDAFECDAGTRMGRRLCRLTRVDQSLWPADATTATACGVAFVPTEFAAGEHIASVAEAHSATRAAPQTRSKKAD